MAANPFDQFDTPTTTVAASNPFDQFDEPTTGAPPPRATFDPASLDPTLGSIYAPGQTPVIPSAPTNPGGGQLAAVKPEGEAFGRGAVQGATFGFGDEIYGLAPAVGGVFTGEGFGPAYNRGVDESRASNERSRAAHPGYYATGQIAGGIAVTAPMIAAAPVAFGAAALPASVARLAPNALGATAGPILPRMVAGGISGAGLSAVQGAGEAQGGFLDRAAGAATSLPVGGGFGFLGPVAGSAVAPVFQGATNYLATRGVPVPGLGNRAANTMADVYAASPAGAIESRVGELGAPAMLADASPAFGSLTRGLVNRTEGQGRNVVVGALEGRNEGVNDRVRASLDTNLGPAPVPSQVEGQFARIRAQAGQRYEDALTNGPTAIDTSPVLAEIGQRLNTTAGAERNALVQARNMLVEQGPNGVVPRTDPRYLHNVKGALDNLITYGDQAIGVPRGALSKADGSTSRIRGVLNDQLEAGVSGYRDANLMASTAHRASEAFEGGRNTLSNAAVHPADFAAGFEASPIERQAAARLGVRSDIDQTVGQNVNDLLAVRNKLKGEGDWSQAKAGTAFGQEPVQNVVQDLGNEIAMRRTYNEAVHGSTTAGNLLGAKAVDVRSPSASGSTTDISLAGLTGGPYGVAGAVGVRGAKYGFGYLGQRSDIARNNQLAEGLTRQGPELDLLIDAVRDRAAVRAGQDSTAGTRASQLAQALIANLDQPQEVRDATRMKALQMGRFLTNGTR